MAKPKIPELKGGLRRSILGFVGGLILISLLGSTVSLYRITEVNRSFDAINKVSIPLGKLLTLLQADSDVFRREVERRLGYAHWSDPHWRARSMPRWHNELIHSELTRIGALLQQESPWALPAEREQWKHWLVDLRRSFETVTADAEKLYALLEKQQEEEAAGMYPAWMAAVDSWSNQVRWGTNEYERLIRQSFSRSEARVSDLRIALEVILVVVVSLSLLLLWFGERALRPLADLTLLARQIARRGLRKEDKAMLPEFPLSRSDEVSQLAREFHNMATALLEREKTVESQKERLRMAENLAAVGRMSAQVAHEVRNPLHAIGLEAELAAELAAKYPDQSIKQSLQSILVSVDRLEKITANYLKLSKMSAGEKNIIDLNQSLESVLATYASACESGGVKVDWSCLGGSPLLVLGDRDLLEQVLGNLLKNALEALTEKEVERPMINWKLGLAESGRAWIRIEDNGPGVLPEVRGRLFTPFVTTRAHGTGLGLSFVKKVVEDHGGEIRYDDTSTGAAFEIVLPMALVRDDRVAEVAEVNV